MQHEVIAQVRCRGIKRQKRTAGLPRSSDCPYRISTLLPVVGLHKASVESGNASVDRAQPRSESSCCLLVDPPPGEGKNFTLFAAETNADDYYHVHRPMTLSSPSTSLFFPFQESPICSPRTPSCVSSVPLASVKVPFLHLHLLLHHSAPLSSPLHPSTMCPGCDPEPTAQANGVNGNSDSNGMLQCHILAVNTPS